MKKDRFKEMHIMINHTTGEESTVKEWGRRTYNDENIKVYTNSMYQVVKHNTGITLNSDGKSMEIIHLSIKRRDKEPIHDWRDLQNIKNEIVGRYYEGVELYPAESRKVDTANQYHLWVFNDPKFRFGFGFNQRLVTDNTGDYAPGSKQRRITTTLWDKTIGAFRLRKLLKVWKTHDKLCKEKEREVDNAS